MPRLLRSVLLHLLVLSALLTAGFWFARASEAQVALLGRTEAALREANAAYAKQNQLLVIEARRTGQLTALRSDVRRARECQQIHQAAKAVGSRIKKLTRWLIRSSGGSNPDSSSYAEPRAEAAVMMGLLSGKGAIYTTELTEWLEILRRRVDAGPSAKNIGLSSGEGEAAEIPATHSAWVRRFVGMPLVGILADLQQVHLRALQVESAALRRVVGEPASAYLCGFCTFEARASTEQLRLLLGDTGRATLYLSRTANLGLELGSPVWQGKKVPWRSYQVAHIEFVAIPTTAGYDAWGRSSCQWSATQSAVVFGRDTTLYYTADYIVTRPRFDITVNGQEPTLARHQRNRLHIYHQMPPPPGTALARFIQLEGGRLLSDSLAADIDVLPTAPVLRVHVLDPPTGDVLHTETFRTVAAP